MTTLRIGSLFSGYGGLGLAVMHALGARTAWHCEIEPAPAKVLAARWPGVPNLGDITAVDWSAVEPVDVLTGGFPCQDVSHAGRRAGLGPGTRSGLWARMADAIDHLQPRLVVAENVRGLLSAPAASDVESCPWCLGETGDGEPAMRALGAVLADLAELGYDAAWCGLRAADVGAPHGRFRVFVAAWPAADAEDDRLAPLKPGGHGPERTGVAFGGAAAPNAGRLWRGEGWATGSGEASRGWAFGDAAGCRVDAAADTSRDGRDQGRPEPAGLVGGPDAALGGTAAADADGGQPERWGVVRVVGSATAAEPHQGHQRERAGDSAWDRCAAAPDSDGDGLARLGRVDAVGRDADGCSGPDAAWGAYEPAVRRWERATGRRAPAPTELSAKGSPRLSPRFVEWMMGLPAGWVTDVPGISRNDQLKMLGNGVVPQQGEEALRRLLGAVNAR